MDRCVCHPVKLSGDLCKESSREGSAREPRRSDRISTTGERTENAAIPDIVIIDQHESRILSVLGPTLLCLESQGSSTGGGVRGVQSRGGRDLDDGRPQGQVDVEEVVDRVLFRC